MDTLAILFPLVKEVKKGKASKHTSTAKGKKYFRAKVYLPDGHFINRDYRMLEAKDIEYTDFMRRKSRGRGYIIIFPKQIGD